MTSFQKTSRTNTKSRMHGQLLLLYLVTPKEAEKKIQIDQNKLWKILKKERKLCQQEPDVKMYHILLNMETLIGLKLSLNTETQLLTLT